MKKIVGICVAVALIAAICGGVYYIQGKRRSREAIFMQEHPYTFEQQREVGAEQTDVRAENGGCLWAAWPKTRNAETDRVLQTLAIDAQSRFESLTAAEQQKDKKERKIPRVICDYKAAKTDQYGVITVFSRWGLCDESGACADEQSAAHTYYVGADGALLDLDALLGENTQKKLDIMLRGSDLSTRDLEEFRLENGTLKLCWANAEKSFSVQEIERASLVDPDKPMVALTFDDGPGGLSRDFADLLAKYNARGTFFALGVNVPTYADDLKYVYEQGNEVGSHTMNHRNLNQLSESQIRAELEDSYRVIEEAIGVAPQLVRTPYGNCNSKVMGVLQRPMISWSVDTEDWKSRNAQAVKNEILRGIHDGGIILMHEIYQSTYDGLALALEELKDSDYQFVTVSELMQYKGVTMENKIYYDAN